MSDFRNIAAPQSNEDAITLHSHHVLVVAERTQNHGFTRHAPRDSVVPTRTRVMRRRPRLYKKSRPESILPFITGNSYKTRHFYTAWQGSGKQIASSRQ